MTKLISKLLKQAKSDDLFNADLKGIGDSNPRWYASSLEEHLFVAIYEGWYLGKYGVDAWNKLELELRREV